MKFLVAVIALWCNFATAQITQHQISDDGYARVPLQFGFPYYGRVFTESYMFSNGVVGFLNPTNSWCCTGFDLRTNNGTPFNFAIMPLQTDLLNYGQGKFLTEGTPQYQRYKWENISEYGVPSNLNTFGVEIRPSGYIGMHYEQVNISPSRPVTIGMTGDTSKGEYTQFYHGAGYSSTDIISYITPATGDLCLVNPLYSPSCSGYEEAFTSQQCSLNPLYRPSCAGYEVAYFNQQCSINALFNRACDGYSSAYATQQVTSAPTVSAPTVQVSLSGTVAVQTPVVADPVVNEVITRPNNNATNTTTNTVQSNPAQTAEKKQESKPVAKKPTEAVKAEIPTQAIPQPVHEYKAPVILDLAYTRMVKKPIQDNNRSLYFLTMTSQIKHEEMIDGQYRKRD